MIGSNDQQRVTYIVKGGKLVPMPDGPLMMIPTKVLPVAASPLLGWATKLRMGLDYFRTAARNAREERTVAQFIESTTDGRRWITWRTPSVWGLWRVGRFTQCQQRAGQVC